MRFASYALFYSDVGGEPNPVATVMISCEDGKALELKLSARHARKLLSILGERTEVPVPAPLLGVRRRAELAQAQRRPRV